MKGFSELRFVGLKLVIFVFLVSFTLMLLPFHIFQTSAIAHINETYENIYEQSVEGLTKSLSVGYFLWHAMFNAVQSGNQDFVDLMFQEILEDFPDVRAIRIIERPREMAQERDF